jgi:hypothetical protein
VHHGNLVEHVFNGPMSKVTEIRITSEATGLRPENSRQRSESASYSPVESGDMPESSATPQRLLTTPTDSNGRRCSPQSEANVSARAYFKYAILYFVALLIVYIAISWPSMKTLFRRGRMRDKNSYPLLLLGISLVEHEPRATI